MHPVRSVVATLGLAASFLVGVLAGTSAASPATGSENNPNSLALTLSCPFGVVSGNSAGPGAALLLEGGGVAVLQGLTNAAREVAVPNNPGLERLGKLVPCTFDSPRLGEGAVAYILVIAPAR